jgi:gamma-butyrobetaine dioxygenase
VVDGTTDEVRSVRFNARSLEAFEAPADALEHMYRGYKRFGELSNELAVSFTMKPGDAYVVNNTRALHGREAFDDAIGASRWLQGVYADVDAIHSRHRVAAARVAKSSNA